MKDKTSYFFKDGTYLAFDTSTEVGSTCVVKDMVVLDSISFSGKGRHSADLLSKIKEIMSRQELTIDNIEGIVVGEGPGSFTGVRVAAATAKGLCHSLEIPLWAVSSLRAGAVSMDCGEREERLSAKCILFDARENRVYAACYRQTSSGGIETIMGPHSNTIEKILLDCTSPTVFGGDGALRHSHRIREAGFQVVNPPRGMPSAESLCLAIKGAEQLFRVEDISEWEPKYLRVSSAERLRGENGS